MILDLPIAWPDWMQGALCTQTDPEAFYPDKGGSNVAAKKVCQQCDLREQCLGYALANDERHGIWGGLSERERRKLKGPVVCKECGGKVPSNRTAYCSTECKDAGHKRVKAASQARIRAAA